MSSLIVVRVQSADHGTKRIQSKATERLSDFLEKVSEAFAVSASDLRLYLDRGKTKEIYLQKCKTLSACKIRHGDMIFLAVDTQCDGCTSSDVSETHKVLTDNTTNGARVPAAVVEDPVDEILDKMDGRITRERSEQLCRHGPSGKCFHCVPLEPYDEQYLNSADPPIKFLSFHSYLRKLIGGADKGKFATLENISVKIKSGCTSHPPWPEGICTNCQPNAVTLNRQRYRHIDYIQFENAHIVEQFLNYWRRTGNQRVGFLYGRHEHYDKVPLGIKATVAAIYEPPQLCGRSSVELLDDASATAVATLAAALGLQCVGWIFTDLVAQDLTTGTVKHFRGTVNSHFLSAEECVMAAHFQNQHPNPCKLSPDGHFGSKFATVVVTGDADNQIHFEGYQVSNQCMALVRDDCLVPTIDAPELGYIRESSNQQYVPDVFFKEKDKYGNEVTALARPLPVEYLLLDLQAAFPVEPIFTFTASNAIKPFPPAHRDELAEMQDFGAFCRYVSQFERGNFLAAMSSFHLLLYMATCDMLPLKHSMSGLLAAVRAGDDTLAHHWSKAEEWSTVEQMIAASESPPASRQTSYVGPSPEPLPPIGASALWTCEHCTFHNSADLTSCEMCGLPKS